MGILDSDLPHHDFRVEEILLLTPHFPDGQISFVHLGHDVVDYLSDRDPGVPGLVVSTLP